MTRQLSAKQLFRAVLVLAILLSACQSEHILGAVPTFRPTWTPEPLDTPTPTPTSILVGLLPSDTPTDVPPTLVPSDDPATDASTTPPQVFLSTATALAPTSGPFVIVTNTPRPSATPLPDTLTPSPTALPTVPVFIDHYVLRRPFADDQITYWARNYSFGSSDNGNKRVHHGIDFPNPSGIPVLAVADGDVYYAAQDTPTTFGPNTNFYGNVVVIKHYFTDSSGQPVYTLYGHLSRIEMAQGQKVHAGQEVGLVGSTGIAEGAHLHLEVRVGNPNDYNGVHNPELWIKSYSGAGVLAGRITDPKGNLLQNVNITLKSGDAYFPCYSYADNTVQGDSTLHENFAIPDVSDGDYTVLIDHPDGSAAYRQKIHVYAGRTNWLSIVLQSPLTAG